MSSRNQILNSLRDARRPFPDIPQTETYLPMTPMVDRSASALKTLFITEAEKLGNIIHQPLSPADAVETILSLLADDQTVMSWDLAQVPVPGLAETLEAAGITVGSPEDPAVRVGLSGADVALAATGSLVVASGTGKYRTASLLPPVHIAVIKEEQIIADMEQWIAKQREDNLQSFRNSSNIVLISGASRTADIAMQLILGMHGPGVLHVVLVP